MAKKGNNVITLLAVVAVIVVVFGVILPNLGTVRPKLARKIRIKKLEFFHKKAESFIQENNRLPKSLFEVLHKDLKEEGWSFSPKVSSILPDSFNEELKRDPFVGIYDPNSFEKIIEYSFFSGPRGWFIRELKPGPFYKKMLMIDQDGNVYSIEQKPNK